MHIHQRNTVTPRKHLRLWAVLCALWYAFVPWWAYERRCHHAGMPYIVHFGINLDYAWVWITGRYTLGDIRFELRENWKPYTRIR